MSTATVVFMCVGVAVGWAAHMLWDVFVDWLYAATGTATGILQDLLAMIGVVALCYVGYLALR